jgi:hypothetical protein
MGTSQGRPAGPGKKLRASALPAISYHPAFTLIRGLERKPSKIEAIPG